MTRRTATFAAVAALVATALLVGAVAPAAAAGGQTAAGTAPDAALQDGAALHGGATFSGGAASAAAPASTAVQDDCSFPVTETDATGTEVTLEEAPERVVVTAPSAAQTIWELDEEERVVGMPVNEFSTYLEGAKNRTHVLDESGVATDTEQVVELEPDLVIAPGVTAEDDVEAMREVGLTVYYEGSTGSLDDIQSNVETTGRLLGGCDAADDTVQWMDDRVAAVEDAVADEDRPTVYYWLGEGYTAPPGSFQHDLIERAGGRNAAEDLEMEGWTLADEEGIVEVDPTHLLLQGEDPVPDSEAIQATTAVQEDNVVRVNANYWNQNAPRVVLALESLAAQLHPGAAEEAGLSAEPEPRSGEESDGGEDAIPGMGVGAAVAALLALAAVLIGRGS